MNAYKFVKKHGLEKAKAVVDGAPDRHNGFNDVIGKYTRGVWFSRDVLISDLKQAISDFEFVESWGGVDKAKAKYRSMPFNTSIHEVYEKLKEAIQRIEQGLKE